MKRHLVASLLVIAWLALPALVLAAESKPQAPPPAPAYTGLKKRLAVAPIEIKVATTTITSGDQRTTVTQDRDPGPGNLGSNMTEQLTTALVNTGRFIVLERKALSDVRGEQALARSGEVNPVTAPTPGMLIGAEWIIKAAVTEYESKASRSLGGAVFHGLGLGGKRSTAKVVLDVRLLDATTGEVIDSVRASGDAKSSGVLAAAAVRGVVLVAGKEDNTPIGQATRTALGNAVEFICQRMEQLAWRGRVVAVDGAEIIINAGAKANVRVGDQFDLFKLGRKLVDPDTGQVLGQRETKGGRLEVTEVQDKLAICRLASGSPPAEGDVIRRVQ